MGQCSCICCKQEKDDAIIQVVETKNIKIEELPQDDEKKKNACFNSAQSLQFTKLASNLADQDKGGGLQGSATVLDMASVGEKTNVNSMKQKKELDGRVSLSLEIETEKKNPSVVDSLDDRSKGESIKSKLPFNSESKELASGAREIWLESTSTSVVIQKIKMEKELSKGRNVQSLLGDDLSKPKIDLIKVCDKNEASIPIPLYEEEMVGNRQKELLKLSRKSMAEDELKVLDIPL